jgi:hypothetical protein
MGAPSGVDRSPLTVDRSEPKPVNGQPSTVNEVRP